MINHKGSFYLGVFVFIIPFLGFPTIWKMGFVLFAGILLILTSIKLPVSRKVIRYPLKKENNEEPVVVSQNKTIEPKIVPPTITPETEVVKTPIIIKKVSARTTTRVDSVRRPKLK